jgi:hypothetical protein
LQIVEHLVDLKDRLIAGEFINQKEIADYSGKSAPMGRKYLNKGIAVGLWTQDDISRGFSKGKRRRALNQTSAPIRPSTDWMDDAEEEPEGSEEELPL